MTYPLIYTIVAYEPRYRIPIDVMLYALAGVAGGCLVDNRAGALRLCRLSLRGMLAVGGPACYFPAFWKTVR
jgi:hypothetical protein